MPVKYFTGIIPLNLTIHMALCDSYVTLSNTDLKVFFLESYRKKTDQAFEPGQLQGGYNMKKYTDIQSRNRAKIRKHFFKAK